VQVLRAGPILGYAALDIAGMVTYSRNPEFRAIDIEVHMTSASFTALQRQMWAPLHDLARLPAIGALDHTALVDYIRNDLEVRDALHRYTYFLDGGDLDAVMGLFADNCTLVNPRGTYIGTQAIRENYAFLIKGRKFVFHNVTNIVARVLEVDREAALAAFYNAVIAFPSGELATFAGTYADKMTKQDGVWKVVQRRITCNHQTRLKAESIFDPSASIPRPTFPETSSDWIGPSAIA
jgi:ketosteroid isomerase-like protein